ncbi:MAG: hypothetical protein M3N08_07365 [Pseudomonadota bacterium]|nr:hypothetical protein [Pseudomonadota bacterium]
MANMMNTPSSSVALDEHTEHEDTGVVWSAILGGTVAASAFIVLLAPLGAGLGFAWVSPWQDMNMAEKTFTLASAVWLIVVQWISSGVGGYLTGRLRTAWPGAHTHEVFFRDTAHGFLTWALTSVLGILLIASGAMHMGEKHSHADAHGNPESYAVSKLFRSDQAPAALTEQDRADSGLILQRLAAEKEGTKDSNDDADKAYLAQLVTARTGLATPDAQKRVDDTVNQFRDSQKAIHKKLGIAALFGFLSMWIGALIACAAGALGGQHRDLHYTNGHFGV